ncbi:MULTISPECIES: PQQ-binding-like beta-propeller repeat protein [Haloarcula]|jgi:outer membrane protein assembly factor BamB|uniref:PQQ-like beta-propeller repeat protein n=2 Tax=Haloarcula TaxID=2237 RepID=A0A8J7YPG9_9EURY|nr:MULTISPECIES: PQQ-binding-like beta-propeller repeat protein [Halomicroarcula]MBX0288754.1 PQQ-like beta-propeller repeat protein [Halomicroarcula salinisoli]MBX0305526.1 PQQ-like beta-propeller repeat protein [Halomicroarcula salinisoli]MDS0283771.1 PQQ-like beta-propeller repeat protein [Halomicroarcula sp. S3CR25-11]
MRRRTALGLVVVFVALAALVGVGLGLAGGGELTEQWVSDTPRDNRVNHHAVGVGPDGEVIIAPVAEVPNSDTPITNTSCALVRLDPGDGSTMWRTGVPADACFTHALTEPAIEDVDSDGTLEVIVSSTEDAVVAYSATNGSEEWRVSLPTYGYGRPTVANVTPAAGREIVTSDIEGNVAVVRGNGTVVWRVALNDTRWSRASVWEEPVVEDVDGDGTLEVFLGTSRGPVLLSADGGVEWQRNGSATTIASAQVDDDPAVELFTTGTSELRAYDGETGDTEWSRDLTNTRIKTATDGDGDGTPELYVGQSGRFLALDAATGETEWSTTVSDSDDATATAPVTGDVDGDDQQEVVGVLNTGRVAVLDADSGSELAVYERDVPVWTFPTVRDIDGDGAAEILVRYGDGRVVSLDYSSSGLIR